MALVEDHTTVIVKGKTHEVLKRVVKMGFVPLEYRLKEIHEEDKELYSHRLFYILDGGMNNIKGILFVDEGKESIEDAGRLDKFLVELNENYIEKMKFAEAYASM